MRMVTDEYAMADVGCSGRARGRLLAAEWLATPVGPVTPVAQGCQICRFIDTQGDIWFSECRLPPCIPTPGDGSCGDCCFSLPRRPGFSRQAD